MNDIRQSIIEIEIVAKAEDAYYRAYPNKNNRKHKAKVISKLISFIKEDTNIPPIRELVSYAKDCYS